MSSFETQVETTTPPPEPKKESSDAQARRILCTNPANTAAFNLLVEMHTYKRPQGSKTERRFIHNFIAPTGAKPDKFGNYYLCIGKAPIMWSSHTDTVHHNKGIQTVGYDGMEIGIAAEDNSKASCLGADDTVGVWHMLQMIKAKVPGLYVFHRQEEGGRKGSQYIARAHGDLLKNVKYCIALDRREADSVITFQSGDRTCSDEFGKSLIEQLDMDYKLDTTGSFTDSYSYIGVIGECTNISVGYTGAHTTSERLNLGHAFKLREKLAKFDWTKLVSSRVAGTTERKTYSYTGGGCYGMSDEWGFNGMDQDWVQNERGCWVRRESLGYGNGRAYGSSMGGNTGGTSLTIHSNGNRGHNGHFAGMYPGVNGNKTNLDIAAAKAKEKAAVDKDEDDDDGENDMELMTKLVARNSQAIAEILDQLGVKYDDLQNEVIEMYGVVNC